jgi:hypothetical protein
MTRVAANYTVRTTETFSLRQSAHHHQLQPNASLPAPSLNEPHATETQLTRCDTKLQPNADYSMLSAGVFHLIPFAHRSSPPLHLRQTMADHDDETLFL